MGHFGRRSTGTPRNMAGTPLSLREAADAAGTSKSTIFRAIKAGRLSAARTDDGGFAIDPAELFRVYPKKPTQAADETGGNVAAGQGATGVPAHVAALLEEQVKSLRETIRRLDEQVADIREDRDRWRTQAEGAQRLLTDQRVPERRSWWRRVVG